MVVEPGKQNLTQGKHLQRGRVRGGVCGGKEQDRWDEELKEMGKLTPLIKESSAVSMVRNRVTNINIFLVLFYIREIVVLFLRTLRNPRQKQTVSHNCFQNGFSEDFSSLVVTHWVNCCKQLIKDLSP